MKIGIGPLLGHSPSARVNLLRPAILTVLCILFATATHADNIRTGTGTLTIPDGSTVTAIDFIPYPDGVEWNNAYEVTFTMPDLTGTVEGNSLLGYWATLDFATPVSDVSFEWLASSIFYATDNTDDTVGNGCFGCTGAGYFAGPGITQINWQAGDEVGGIESISYTMDSPEPSSLLLFGVGLAALIGLGGEKHSRKRSA